MKKNNRYIIGMLFLLSFCLLMYVFSYTAENIRLFYCVLEYLGLYDGYKYSIRNLIIWAVIVVLLVVLLKVAFKLINSDKEFLKKHPFLKILPYLIICINISSCYFFPKIDRLILKYRHGLDGIIVSDRGTTSLLAFGGVDTDGNQIGPVLSFSFESFGSEREIFYVKLIHIDDETNQYILCDKNEIPQKFRMGELSNTWDINKGNYKARHCSFVYDLEKIIPGYIHTPENSQLINYKVIIFNENESKTFYIYNDKFY